MAVDNGTTWKNSLANSQVNDSTDSVYGQLQRHSDPNSITNRRIIGNAKQAGSARGLGNSTVIQGLATGAVIDAASKNAAIDAEIYSNRRTENQRSGTQLESTAMQGRNNLAVQGVVNEGALSQIAARGVIDTNIAAGKNATDLARTGLTTASNERIGEASNATSITTTGMTNDTSRQNTQDTIEGNKDITTMNNESSEGIAANKITSDQLISNSTIASNESIAWMDNDTKLEVAALEIEYNQNKDRDATYDTIWSDTANALANIDPNASPESQKTMTSRIMTLHTERNRLVDERYGVEPEATTPYTGSNWQANVVNGTSHNTGRGNGPSGLH